MWTMLIVAVAGGAFSSNASFQSIPFQNKEACSAAATALRKGTSKSIGFVCISSETGEAIKFIQD